MRVFIEKTPKLFGLLALMILFSSVIGCVPVYASGFTFADIQATSTGITVSGTGDADLSSATTKIQELLQWATGILTLFAIFCLIWQFFKLSASGGNEMERKKAMQGILTSGVAVSLFGSGSIVIGFFWNMFAEEVEDPTPTP